MKRVLWRVGLLASAMLMLAGSLGIGAPALAVDNPFGTDDDHMVTIYDEGVEKTILTKGTTVKDAVNDAMIHVDQYDTIEPGLDKQLGDALTIVNIRRARPVTVTDGNRHVRIVTAATDESAIARAVNADLLSNDTAEITRTRNFLAAGGAGLQMKITRAKTVKLILYGQNLTLRTQQPSVRAFLTEIKVALGVDDTTSVPLSDKIMDGMVIEVWRNGLQSIEQAEDVPFDTEQVKDPTKKVGFREIQTTGQVGKKTVIYQVNMQNGKEVGRNKISEVVTVQPVKQIEVIGTKPINGDGLTKSKGVVRHTDSNGVVHRETYYDLDMGRVMKQCGQGGYYAVRDDGVKVDRDGYVIVAAHLGRYPRCSVVETSIGPGKVYDTGGFVSTYPDGFDLATDWSNNNGR